MKTILFFLTFILANFISLAQYTSIPDANFENALSAYDDIPNDGQVPTNNINTITFLSLYDLNISDLTGIEDFSALTYLNCSGNQLTNLDVSQNTNLTYLDCSINQLTNLDITNNPSLTTLRCGYNQLTNLDVTQNINLEELSCSDNQLTNLDVTQNVNLEELLCSDNQLTNLDVTHNLPTEKIR